MRTSSVTRAVIVLLTCGLLSAQTWPKEYRAPKQLGTHTLITDSPHHYQSASFDLFTFKKHDTRLLTRFLICAESVPGVLKSLPLPLLAPPPGDRATIKIFASEKAYLAAGGTTNTAGFYDSRQKSALFQWEHFLKDSQTGTPFRKPAFDLVIHELTHLAMHGLNPRVEVWFSEGVAEYLAAAHLGQGHYRFDTIDKAIIHRIKKHTPPDITKIQLPPLEILLQATHRDWLDKTANTTPWQTLESYNASLLLTHYAFHGGQKRRDKVQQHLKNTGRKTLLFPISDAKKIQTSLTSYWSKKGLTLSFRSP